MFLHGEVEVERTGDNQFGEFKGKGKSDADEQISANSPPQCLHGDFRFDHDRVED